MSKSVRTRVAAVVTGSALVFAAGAAASPAQAAAPEVRRAAAPVCAVWDTTAKVAGPFSTAPLEDVRTGRHPCFDRVVFVMNGTATGYNVRYANQILSEDEHRNLVPYTAGGAWLQVRLRAPAGIATTTGTHLADVSTYDTLRDVVYGGASTTRTTVAVGVRAKLPFKVSLLPGPGTDSRIVLDVAHH
jgi:hypothetical protein